MNPTTSTPGSTAPTLSKKRRILLVDDEAGLRRLQTLWLDREQFEILEAGDGHEALRLAFLHRPDLVVLDVIMPGPNGYEVCRQIKASAVTQATKVLILSASKDHDTIRKVRDARADAYMSKPYSSLALRDKIMELLGM
jgi:two-component system phosphate regulon response regulator PhoB